MGEGIYEQLRERIAERSSGFLPTISGVEIKLLRRLFTEEEAEMYLHLSDRLETANQIAERAKQEPQRVATVLKRMTQKGLTFPKRKGTTFYYAAAPYAAGIYDHQVDKMDESLAQLFEEYMQAEKILTEPTSAQLLEEAWPLRVLPVKAPVNISRAVAAYEDVEGIIRNKKRIAVANCVCAVQQGLVGTSCSQPLEVCLLFDFYAEYYIELGMGRSITQYEALKIVDLAEEAGLVHQSPNMLDPGSICNCCRNCCGGLRFLKTFAAPAALVASNYYCQVNPGLCNGCEICVDRCPMSAITMGSQEGAVVNLERCIGCGLCINKCPTESLTLMSKPEEVRRIPPRSCAHMRPSEDYESTIP